MNGFPCYETVTEKCFRVAGNVLGNRALLALLGFGTIGVACLQMFVK